MYFLCAWWSGVNHLLLVFVIISLFAPSGIQATIWFLRLFFKRFYYICCIFYISLFMSEYLVAYITHTSKVSYTFRLLDVNESLKEKFIHCITSAWMFVY